MNHFLVSIRPTLSAKLNTIHQSSKMTPVKNQFALQHTDPQELAETLEELNNKKSRDSDGIINEKLKCCPPVIESLRAPAFNKCILERTE